MLLSQSWARSLEDLRKAPARTRSSWWWVVGVAAMGGSSILLTLWLHTAAQAFAALVFWLPWYAAAVFFLLTHLGMVDNSDGPPHQSLLLPNGLSFIRLALAPLVLWPCLQVPVHPAAGPVFALFLAAAVVIGREISGSVDFRVRHVLCTRAGFLGPSLIGVNIFYLTYQGATWAGRR